MPNLQKLYSFGMEMPGRNFNANQYQYGYNGKLKDDEIQMLNYGFRMYDPRLGRFISTDPVGRQFPFYSPYQYAGNKPIWASDLDGLEPNYTNAVDPVPTELPLYSRRSELDPHTESLPVGKKGFDWQTTTQMNFYYSSGNLKWVKSAGAVFYFEQKSPVCKVTNYKTILVDQTLTTPEEKAEYKVIDNETNIARQSRNTTMGTPAPLSDLANTAVMLVNFRVGDAVSAGGTPTGVNFVVQNINDPNIAGIKSAIQSRTGLSVNVTVDPNILSPYQYSVRFNTYVQTKQAKPATSTTIKVEKQIPVECYEPCPPANDGNTNETKSP